MDKDLFKKQIDKLVIEYSDKGFRMTKERAEQWHSYLNGYDYELFMKAIDHYIKSSPYMPTINEIIRLMDLYSGNSPTDKAQKLIEVLIKVQHMLHEFDFPETAETSRVQVREIYENLSEQDKRYVGDYKSFLEKAGNFSSDEFNKYEKTRYVKFVEDFI